jgi:tetratricopeptide (TPR) repeat protein
LPTSSTCKDEIVSRLANTLNLQLIDVEARRAERSLHPDAMDLIFQGMACLNKGRTSEYLAQSRGFFERALALEPENVEALVGSAIVDLQSAVASFADEWTARIKAAETAATKALSLAPNHAGAHNLLGHIYAFTNRVGLGIAECERAAALDPNLAFTHATIGMAKYFIGRGVETEAHIREALRLSPRDTSAYMWMAFAGTAKLWLGADAEAVAWLRRSVEANRNNPLVHFYLAAALAHLGELDEASAAARAGLELQPFA